MKFTRELNQLLRDIAEHTLNYYNNEVVDKHNQEARQILAENENIEISLMEKVYYDGVHPRDVHDDMWNEWLTYAQYAIDNNFFILYIYGNSAWFTVC